MLQKLMGTNLIDNIPDENAKTEIPETKMLTFKKDDKKDNESNKEKNSRAISLPESFPKSIPNLSSNSIERKLLNNFSATRYKNDFIEFERLGSGGFGSVLIKKHMLSKKFLSWNWIRKNQIIISMR
jgi:hypothetical protein